MAARVRRTWAEMDSAQRRMFELGAGFVAHDDLGRVGPPGHGRTRDAVAARQLAIPREPAAKSYTHFDVSGAPRRGCGGCPGRVRTSATNEDFPKCSTIHSSFASTSRRAMLFRLQLSAGVPGLT